jgi:serine/threonine protein kinase/tetratricopeptide (TPR) repeat protein
MSASAQEIKAILGKALEYAEPEERSGYLRDACGDDAALRAEVASLLQALEKAGSFLESPARGSDAALVGPVAECPGTVIGAYTLVEQIGEGGFGVVFMAEQTQPVRRQVALKVLKPGMDTRQVVGRFEAERQALAIMDHAHIAKVLDGGAAPSGRPYFVMDLVKGVPITEYCDQNHLTPRQRLELFIPVCQAVQHAHQKGIIHRDLKPSNVLVTAHDTTPVPKVIDFGIAKALGQELTDKTVITGFAQMLGTPMYMSPEQAGQGGLDIDTRSDIYSLGVLLYELLTGTTPFDTERFKQAAYEELRRIIREEDPPKPSTRLSDSKDTLPSISAQRQTEPAKLTKLVRGELDWIVMKALDKDRNRRYQTANDFALDVQRYLADEPVQACPPSSWYRLRKFARRYKKAMATVTAFLVLLVAATATSIGLASWALKERDYAEEQKQVAQTNEKEAKERADEIRAVLEFVEHQVFAASRPLGQEGGLGRDVTLRQAIEAALVYVEESFRDQPLIEARLRATIGLSFVYLGDGKAAETQFERAREIRAAKLGPDHRDTLSAMNNLGSAYGAQGRHRERLALHKETLELRKAKLGPDHPDTLKSMGNVATALGALGHRDDALRLHEETFRLMKIRLGPDHAETLRAMHNLAQSYRGAGRNAEALELAEETLRRRKAMYGPKHPNTLLTRRIVGRIYAALGRHTDALGFRKETLRLQIEQLGPDHPQTLFSMEDLAASCYALGRHEEALKLREETLPLMKAKFGAGSIAILSLMNALAQSYDALGRAEEAAKVREEMRQARKARP